MDNSVKLFRCISVHLCSVVVLLQIGATLCCANFNYAVYNTELNVIKLVLEVRSDDHCQQIGQYNVTVNRCDGEFRNLSTPAMNDDNEHIEVMVSHSLCGSKCTVQFQGSEVCIMLLNISAPSKLLNDIIFRIFALLGAYRLY